MKTYVPWALAALFLATAVYFFVLLIDAGISLDGARVRNDQLQERGKVSLELIKRGWIGESKASLLVVAESMKKNGVIVKSHSETVEVGEVVFSVSGDDVVDARYMD